MPWTPVCLSESPMEALLAQTELGTPKTSKKSLIRPPFWRAFGTNIWLEFVCFFTHLLNASWEPFEPIFQRMLEGLGGLLGLTYETFWGTCESLIFATPLTRKPRFRGMEGTTKCTLFKISSRPVHDILLESVLMTSWYNFGTFWDLFLPQISSRFATCFQAFEKPRCLEWKAPARRLQKSLYRVRGEQPP